MENEVLTKNWDTLDGDDFSKIMEAGIFCADHMKLQVLDENGFETLYFLDISLP